MDGVRQDGDAVGEDPPGDLEECKAEVQKEGDAEIVLALVIVTVLVPGHASLRDSTRDRIGGWADSTSRIESRNLAEEDQMPAVEVSTPPP